MFKFIIVFNIFNFILSGKAENVLVSEVFKITLNPSMFNWTLEDRDYNQFVYQPSLLNSPDLPTWINYKYSVKYKAGFIYGVPLSSKPNSEILLQIIALNKNTYETRQNVLSLHINEKLNPAKNQVEIKIDNLNVEDMFESKRMTRLKDVFRKKLWKESDQDLYVTFLASAIQLGARLPPNPNEGEGVVIRIGSTAPFSTELMKLQAEVKPLEKVPFCPRNFKRTTVEKYFREAGFALDWCKFRLFADNSSILQSTTTVEKLSSITREHNFKEHWDSLPLSKTPRRSYTNEFALSVILPLFLLALLGFFLFMILCFHHEVVEDEESEFFFDNVFHICTDYYYEKKRIQDAKKIRDNSFSTDQQKYETRNDVLTINGINFSQNMSVKSRSPTFPLTSDVHARPSPPPYVRPKFKPAL